MIVKCGKPLRDQGNSIWSIYLGFSTGMISYQNQIRHKKLVKTIALCRASIRRKFHPFKVLEIGQPLAARAIQMLLFSVLLEL